MTTILPFIVMAVAAYLLGSVPMGYILPKWTRGIDVRKMGTGKIGASNVLRVTSKKLAIAVSVFDVAKGAVPVLVAQYFGLEVWQQMTVGLVAIAGHNWPIYLRFHGGGRGIYTSLGVIAAMSWKLGIICAAIAYSWAPAKQVALGVFIGLLALPFLSWFLAGPLGVRDRVYVTIGFALITILAYGKRLIARRSELSKSLPWR